MWTRMYCFWIQFYVKFWFLKKLKQIISGADYMKKTSLLSWRVCVPSQTAAWYYMQGMNNCKRTESFCLSILNIAQMIGALKFLHVYCCQVYFISVRFLNKLMPRKTVYLLWQPGLPGLAFSRGGLGHLRRWLG